MNLIEIFRAGTRPDANGNTVTITADMLRQAVDSYDPATHEAPIVVGHPQSNLPAYGWAKSLTLDGDVLKAEPQQVDPAFAEMVSAGRFKKISASFYLPESPGNPKKGVLYLRHIGFLGAQPPAVKGLRDPVFGEATQDGIVEFTESLNTKPTENMMDKEQLAAAQAEAAKAQAEAAAAQAEAAKAKEEIEKLKAEAAQAQEAKVTAELEQAKAENASFCEGLVKDGKLAPIVKDKALALLNAAAALAAGRTADFGEGETSLTQLKVFLSSQPKVVEFGEVATRDKAGDKAPDDVQYAETDDPARVELDRRVRAYMQQHKTDYATALDAVL